MLTGEQTFKLPFTGVNLDRDQVEKLPQPYRFLSKIIDGLVEEVNDRILEIEKRKRQQVFEYNLPEIFPTGQIVLDDNSASKPAAGPGVLDTAAAGGRGSAAAAPPVVTNRINCIANSSSGHVDVSSSTGNYTSGSNSVAPHGAGGPSSKSVLNTIVACGTESGELIMLDLQGTGRLVCNLQLVPKQPPPVVEEDVEEGAGGQAAPVHPMKKPGSVTHVAMTTGFLKRRAICENCSLWRSVNPKVVAAVNGQSYLKVCEFRNKDYIHSEQLVPFAKLQYPQEVVDFTNSTDGDADGGPGSKEVSPVRQISTWGNSGALWTCAFLLTASNTGKVFVYRSSLGKPLEKDFKNAAGGNSKSFNSKQPFTIQEEGETDAEQGLNDSLGPGNTLANGLHDAAKIEQAWDDAEKVATVATPLYSVSLPGFSMRATAQPLPPMSSIFADFFFVCGESTNEKTYSRPGSLVLWSEKSNLLYFGSIPMVENECDQRGAMQAQDGSLDLTEVPLDPIDESVKAVAETKSLCLNKHWLFMDAVSAVGRSASGTVIGVGTETGTVTLWSGWTMSNLFSDCPGHYGRVESVSFAGNARVLTGGSDGWVHVLSCETGKLIFRTNTCPAFEPCHSLCHLLSGFVPLAIGVSEVGQLRLWDTRLSDKLGKLIAAPEGSCLGENTKLHAGYDSFAVFQTQEGQTCVSVYDTNMILSNMFAGISARLENSRSSSASKLFRVLTSEQRKNPPAKDHRSTATTVSGPGQSSANRSVAKSTATSGGGSSAQHKSASSSRGRSSPKKKGTLTQASLMAHEVQYDLPAGATQQQEIEPNPLDLEWRRVGVEKYRGILAEKATSRKKVTVLLDEVHKKIQSAGGS
ncbi:unnamed protein product [Amoebophrya sp. A120]|nr:unnamed protein product [Amoebophrya sp. A120]|eukprot:GSA120T00012382001.1